MTDVPPDEPPRPTHREPRADRGAGQPPEPTHRERRPTPPPPETHREVPGQAQSLTNLPSALRDRYRLLGDLGTPGGESRLVRAECLVDDGLPGTTRVVKIYDENLTIDFEALTRLQAMDRDHVIGLAEWGESDGHWYEVQEHIGGGNLYTLRDRLGGFDDGRLVAVIAEFATAVHGVHGAGVLHKDVKPANVLVRADEPLDLVLGDFGLSIAANLSKHFVSNSRTPWYASPEVFLNTFYEASDWWSVGMSIAELALGAHPLQELHELAIGSAIHDRAVNVDGIANPRVRALCQGLLVPQHERRWGWPEVERWLAGADPPVPQWSALSFQIQPLELGGQQFADPPTLAVALGQAWREAARLVRGGALQTANLRRFLEQFSTYHRVAALLDDWDDRSVTADRRVAELLVALDPQLPFLPFRTVDVSVPGLRQLAGEVAGDGTASAHAGTLADLQQHRILEVYGTLRDHARLAVIDQEWARTETLALQALAAAGRPSPNDDIRLALKARALMVVADPRAAHRAVVRARWIALRYGKRCTWLAPLRKRVHLAGYAIAVIALEDEIRQTARPAPAGTERAGARRRPPAGSGRRVAISRAVATVAVVAMVTAGLYAAAVAAGLDGVRELEVEGEGVGRAAADITLYWLPALALLAAVAVLAFGQARFAVPIVGVVGALAFLAGAGVFAGWAPPVTGTELASAGTRNALLNLGGQPHEGVAVAAGVAAVAAVALAQLATAVLGVGAGLDPRQPAPRALRRQQVVLLALAAVGIVALSAQAASQFEGHLATASSRGGSPPVNGWIAQLASLPVSDGATKRDRVLADVRQAIPEAEVLRTDDYASLGPGFWVVYLPQAFTTGSEAIAWCNSHGRGTNNACYAAYLSRFTADKGRYCVREGNGLAGDC